ncbi:unnamed protein product [Lactuca saligna]|uniref:Uncharacterized protein n=1 Tax=Lactuca saligna TaxID=75948 RepID=A0AA35YYX9_LACSI|nr:unnamed protein product [Lactuca saligna]
METGVLFPQTNEKKSKKSKKTDAGSSGTKVKPVSSSKSPKQVPIIEAEPIQPEPIVADTQLTEKEVIPSKTGVFIRIKMKLKSKHKGRSSLTNIVHKPQVSHQGIIFLEVPAPASPSSKKRIVADMAKQISKNNKRRVILTSESTADEGETILETPEADLIKDSSQLDTSVSTPPKVLIAKIVTVEARTSDISVNISDMDTNVIMGEDDSNKAAKGNLSSVVSYSFISLPQQITPIVPITSTTDSPTFANIISQPFTTLFSSQATDPPTTTSPIKDSFIDTENESEGFGGSFENLEFDEEETGFPYHMLMMMKQFKILNTKLNSIIESQADLGAVTKFARLYESLSPQITQLSTNDNKNFMEVFELLKELKSLSSKPTVSLLSSEDLIQKFSKFEELLVQHLAPLS